MGPGYPQDPTRESLDQHFVQVDLFVIWEGPVTSPVIKVLSSVLAAAFFALSKIPVPQPASLPIALAPTPPPLKSDRCLPLIKGPLILMVHTPPADLPQESLPAIEANRPMPNAEMPSIPFISQSQPCTDFRYASSRSNFGTARSTVLQEQASRGGGFTYNVFQSI